MALAHPLYFPDIYIRSFSMKCEALTNAFFNLKDLSGYVSRIPTGQNKTHE